MYRQILNYNLIRVTFLCSVFPEETNSLILYKFYLLIEHNLLSFNSLSNTVLLIPYNGKIQVNIHINTGYFKFSTQY